MTRHINADSFYEAEYGEEVLLRDRHHEHWLAFESDWGDWWAVRPRSEDDDVPDEGKRWTPIGPVSVEILPFPVVAVKVHDALKDDKEQDHV